VKVRSPEEIKQIVNDLQVKYKKMTHPTFIPIEGFEVRKQTPVPCLQQMELVTLRELLNLEEPFEKEEIAKHARTLIELIDFIHKNGYFYGEMDCQNIKFDCYRRLWVAHSS
jgi:hypothetical protein